MISDLTETALSVGGLNRYLQSLMEEDPQLQQVWVTGEVSSCKDHRSGLFFTLSDPADSASIRCVVWSSLKARLVEVPRLGEQVIVLGSVKLFAKRGEYQLSVFQVLTAGEGLLALRYQQLRARLTAEGLFDPQRKRSLPTYPATIGVVTSPTAAAWGDIQRTLNQRYPALQVLLSPAIVQGEQAPDSIVTAIERLNGDVRAELLLLARGGGATEDLACFNDERVVWAIASSEIPVVTGIGHQRDESLADLAADVCAHTPTAAAELVTPDFYDLYEQHRQRAGQLFISTERQLKRETERWRGLRDRCVKLPTSARGLQQAVTHCDLLRQKLATLDPHNVLQRGYALVKDPQGEVVRSAQQVHPHQQLTVELGQGQLTVEVKSVTPGLIID